MLDLAASFLALTAFFAYVNYRFVKLPTTIGVMSIALLLSAVVFGLDWLGTLLSIIFIGFGPWASLPLLGITLPLTYRLVFGALISGEKSIVVKHSCPVLRVSRSGHYEAQRRAAKPIFCKASRRLSVHVPSGFAKKFQSVKACSSRVFPSQSAKIQGTF